jgi:hypothetical protein
MRANAPIDIYSNCGILDAAKNNFANKNYKTGRFMDIVQNG